MLASNLPSTLDPYPFISHDETKNQETRYQEMNADKQNASNARQTV
jgi:hypothetical protein